MKLTHQLRKLGIYGETDITGRSLKAQMKYADKIGAQYAIVLGENELGTGQAELKNLRGGEKQMIKLCDIATIVKDIEE